MKIFDPDKFKVFPYTTVDGQVTFSNSFIWAFYNNLEFKADIFYNVQDLDQFNALRYFQSVRLYLGFIETECVGGMWISTFNDLNRSGYFNFGSTGILRDRKMKLWAGYTALKLLLDMPGYNLILGETSVSNYRTRAVAEAFGFKELCRIPGAHWHAREQKFQDTILTYINKDLLVPIAWESREV